MQSPDPQEVAGVVRRTDGRGLLCSRRPAGQRFLQVWAVGALLVLALTASSWARADSDDEAFVDLPPQRRENPIDEMTAALRRYGRVFLYVGLGLSGLLVLKIVAPVQVYYGFQERRLKRAVWGVDELLKRIQKEAEVTSEAPTKDDTQTENGLLAGMMEMAEFEQAEQVPPYVLTVNDLMLDNMAVTIRKLRRFTDGSAEKYQDNMFAVLHGIQTITEQSEEAGVASGLAVDIREYFKDEHRYKTWRKVLGPWAKKGEHQDTASAFLGFMRSAREGRAVARAKPPTVSLGDTAVTKALDVPDIPESLNEDTLPAVQKAAAEEARNLCALVQTDTPAKKADAWQFDLVRRQQQIHTREAAQQMLTVFLSCERKALQEITKVKMLPCRTWGHVLHLLGVEDTGQLQKRAESALLSTQEIILLEKAFLQTFAKRELLERLYSQGQAAGHKHDPSVAAASVDLMIDTHVPEIRREALAVLRLSHRTEPGRLDAATDALNEEETPQNHQVRKLIEHYMK
ncbi:MAG: hypothetical protein KBE65_19470 [Phycisphaerae bacterium]|nr:hypothetical protein [Phycisphaerae bacterium]